MFPSIIKACQEEKLSVLVFSPRLMMKNKEGEEKGDNCFTDILSEKEDS
jgi:hypothetical protein